MSARPPIGLFVTLWRRLSLRHWREDLPATLLLVLLLALGVASFLSIRMANREAVAGFDLFHQSLQPRSDWIVRNPAGRFDATRLFSLRERFGTLPARIVPVVETSARKYEAEKDSPSFRVVGLDLIALGGSGDTLTGTIDGGPEAIVATTPASMWIAEDLAQAWQTAHGGSVQVIFNTKPIEVTIAGTLPAHTPAGETPPRLAVMDLPALQAIAGLGNRIDRIEVELPDARHWASSIAEVKTALEEDPQWVLSTAADEPARGAEMTAAFRLNLTILSLIALLVALSLIAQALDATVVRRRQEIGILRSLGATPGALRTLWLGEFALLGLIGAAGGTLLGWGMAQATAGAVAQTVNQLYFPTAPRQWVFPTGSDLVIGLALGLGGSLVGGWLPMRDAARTPPAQVLAAGNFTPGFGLLRNPGVGIALVLGGVALWYLPPLSLDGGARFPLAGYGAAFAWLLGGTLLTGSLFGPLAQVFRCMERRSAPLRLARARLGEATSRHRLAAAGLFVALAMAGGMSVLVSSFSRTMEDWIEVRFQADLFLSSAATGGAGQEFLLEPETVTEIRNHPDVAEADPFRLIPIQLEGKRTFLGASRFELLGDLQQVLWLEPPEATRFAPGERPPVFVNEAFAARFAKGVGDLLELPTPSGPRWARLAGIFADYGNEQGLAWIDWEDFQGWFDSEAATTLSLFLREGADPLAVGEALRADFPGLAVRDNTTLRGLVRRIFRQTFAITEALKLIGIAVAVGGLGLALGNLLRESRVELETLRRLGMRRAEIARATAWESTGIGLVGLTAGLLTSVGLGALLVFVINKQSFGWTLRWALPWTDFALLAALTLGLAAAVGYTMGRKYGGLSK